MMCLVKLGIGGFINLTNTQWPSILEGYEAVIPIHLAWKIEDIT